MNNNDNCSPAGNLDSFDWHQVQGSQGSLNPVDKTGEVLFEGSITFSFVQVILKFNWLS